MRTPSSRCWSRPCEDASSARWVTPSPASRVERAMQLDRIGRGQRAVDFAAVGETTPIVPMLAACMAERGPDLPGEGGDRGLAAGAGDGGDGAGLARKERGGRAAPARAAHSATARTATFGRQPSGGALGQRPRPRRRRPPAARMRARRPWCRARRRTGRRACTLRLSDAMPVSSSPAKRGSKRASVSGRSDSFIARFRAVPFVSASGTSRSTWHCNTGFPLPRE